MPITSLRPVRPFAAAVAVAALITTGAACSSSSNAASKATTSNPQATSPSADRGTQTTQPAQAAKTSGDTPNPCTIVTAAEVQAITGTAATPTGPTNENRGTVCHWRPGNGSSVLVQVFHGKAFYDPSMQAPSAKKLTGIGDDAYLDDFAPMRAGVGFLKGDVAVFIDGLQITSSDAVVAAARDAASKV
jgi:hypothetical protein